MKKKTSSIVRSPLNALSLAAALVGTAGSTQAATFTWTGLGADNNWSTLANWGGTAPALTDVTEDLQFTGTTRLTPFAEAPYSAKAIYFGPTSGVPSTTDGSFTLGGGDLTLAGGVTYSIYNNTNVAQVVNNNITLSNAAASTIGTNANAGKLTLNGTLHFSGASLSVGAYSFSTATAVVLNGAISGTGSISFSGNGANNSSSIYLNGANTYTAATTVTGVTAYLGGNSLLSAAGVFGTANNVGLGALNGTGNNAYTGVLTNGAYTIDSSFLLNQTSQPANLIVVGGAAAAVSNFTGTISVASGATPANPLVLTAASGGTVNFTGVNKTNSNIIYRGATATGTADSVTKIGTGTVTLQDQSNYQGATIIDQGTLSVSLLANGGAAGSALGKATNAAANLRIQGGTLAYTGAATSTDRLFTIGATGATLDASGTGAVNFSNTGAIVTADAASRSAKLNTSTSVTFAIADVGASADVGDLKAGMTVTGTGISGGTTVSAIAINAITGTQTLTLNQAASSTGVQSLSFGAAASTALTLTGTNTGNNIIAGTLANSVGGSVLGVTKSGVGTWSLSGANTYTGGTTVTAGQLNINSAGALGAGTLTITGGTLGNSSGGTIVNTGNNSQAWNGNFAFAGTNDLDLGTGAVILNAAHTVTVAANNLTVGGVIGGNAFALTKAGAGTLTLTGANTTTGTMSLTGGTLKLGNAAALGTQGIITSPGTTLDLNGQNVAALVTANSLAGEITNSSGTAAAFAVNSSSAANTAGTLSGTGDISLTGTIQNSAFTKIGNNTVTIGGGAANVGTSLIVNVGTVILNKSITGGAALRGLNAGGDVLAVNTGGTAKLGANDQIRNSSGDTLTGIISVYGGTFDINSKTSTVNGLQIGAVDGSTPGSVISTGGTGALTVTGNATWGNNKIVGNSGTASAVLAGATTTFTKLTSGTVTLSAANTYGGGTTVSTGTLLVDNVTGSGTGTGSVSVASGATLGGVGIITPGTGNSITLSGVLSPASSVSTGTLTFDGGTTASALATFASGSSFAFNLTAGVGSDKVALINGAAGDLTFNGNNIAFTVSGSLSNSQTYTLFTSSIAGSYLGLTLDGSNKVTSGLSFTGLGGAFQTNGYISLVGNDLILNTGAIPEPSTYAAIFGALALGGTALYRRRSKKSE